jgi:hypothetical protein
MLLLLVVLLGDAGVVAAAAARAACSMSEPYSEPSSSGTPASTTDSRTFLLANQIKQMLYAELTLHSMSEPNRDLSSSGSHTHPTALLQAQNQSSTHVCISKLIIYKQVQYTELLYVAC